MTLFFGHAGILVQVVDVLRDDAAGALPSSISSRHCMVAAVRLRADPAVAIVEAAAPGLATRLFGSDEILEVDRLHPCPDAAGAAEVGDAGFGADARAGEEQSAAARIEQRAQRVELVAQWADGHGCGWAVRVQACGRRHSYAAPPPTTRSRALLS